MNYNQYKRDSLLNANLLISHEDLENSKKQYLQSCLSVKNLSSTIQNTSIEINKISDLYWRQNISIEKIKMQCKVGCQQWQLNC